MKCISLSLKSEIDTIVIRCTHSVTIYVIFTDYASIQMVNQGGILLTTYSLLLATQNPIIYILLYQGYLGGLFCL